MHHGDLVDIWKIDPISLQVLISRKSEEYSILVLISYFNREPAFIVLLMVLYMKNDMNQEMETTEGTLL
jgi:hypothetical protein